MCEIASFSVIIPHHMDKEPIYQVNCFKSHPLTTSCTLQKIRLSATPEESLPSGPFPWQPRLAMESPGSSPSSLADYGGAEPALLHNNKHVTHLHPSACPPRLESHGQQSDNQFRLTGMLRGRAGKREEGRRTPKTRKSEKETATKREPKTKRGDAQKHSSKSQCRGMLGSPTSRIERL